VRDVEVVAKIDIEGCGMGTGGPRLAFAVSRTAAEIDVLGNSEFYSRAT
jgi:hypothetical protein